MTYVDKKEDAIELLSKALTIDYQLSKEDILEIRDALLEVNNRQSLINLRMHQREKDLGGLR